MSSVSVHQPGKLDARRGAFERAFLWLLRGLLPPARDNQQAADFLRQAIGLTEPRVWEEWKGRMPVVVDATGAMAPARPGATSQARPSPAEP
jgi:hypothetical protein